MALENVGLGGVITVDSSGAVSGLNQGRDALGRFAAGATKASAETASLSARIGGLDFGEMTRSIAEFSGASGRLMLGAGTALLPFTAAMGYATNEAAKFEQQMAVVQSVLQGSKEELAAVAQKAELLGATTAFTSVEAAQGMEELARQGFTAKESIEMVGGVLNAAAADGMPMARSAEVITAAIRSMGLQASDANHVADAFAVTSAMTASSINDLGEAMKYAAPQANAMGISLDDTLAVLGVLANSGLKGSIAGTSMTNMMVKLADPTKAATKYMKELNAGIFEFADGRVDIKKTLESFAPGLDKITSKSEKAAIITEVFGLRGQKAVNAFLMAFETGDFSKLQVGIKNGTDQAEKMANLRLDSFLGDLGKVKSAVNVIGIEVGKTFTGGMRGALDGLVEPIQQIAQGMVLFNPEGTGTLEGWEKLSPTVQAVVKGIHEGFSIVTGAIKTVKEAISDLVQQVSGKTSPEFIQQLTKWATVFAVVAAAVAPILVALGGVAIGIATFLPQIQIVGAALGTAFGPLPIIIAAATAAFLLFHQEGETASQTFSAMFQLLKTGFDFVVNNGIMPFVNAFSEYIEPTINNLSEVITKFITAARRQFDVFASSVAQIFERLAPLFRFVFKILGGIIGWFVELSTSMFSGMFSGILYVAEGLLTIVRKIASWIIEKVINTVIIFITGAVGLADAVGMDVAPELREFIKNGEFKIDDTKSLRDVAGVDVSKSPTKEVVQAKAEAAEKVPEVTANVTIDDKRTIEVSNKVNIDGREVAVAAQKHKQEVNERAGFKATPWQKRVALEQGAAPTGGLGG